jgi:hypothetical protein
MSDPKQNELFRFKNVVFDVASNFGNTTEQSQTRMARLVNRAATKMTATRKWSWLYVKDSFQTVASSEEYSLDQAAGKVQMLWIQDSNRQKLDRIPSRRFRELVPDPANYTGVPRMYDYNGVDSSGCKIVTLYPIPSTVMTIWYRHRRIILPIQNSETNIWSFWGMPPIVIECLIEYATALAFQGIDDARYKSQLQIAEAMTEDAYGEDQENQDTTIQIPFDDHDAYLAGPRLPPEYGL